MPSGQVSHLSPDIPGLQIHLPLICSQSVLTDPYGEQSHAGKLKSKHIFKIDNIFS